MTNINQIFSFFEIKLNNFKISNRRKENLQKNIQISDFT